MHAGRVGSGYGNRLRGTGEAVCWQCLNFYHFIFLSITKRKRQNECGSGWCESESSSINLFVCQVPGVIIVFQAHNLNHKKLLETGKQPWQGVKQHTHTRRVISYIIWPINYQIPLSPSGAPRASKSTYSSNPLSLEPPTLFSNCICTCFYGATAEARATATVRTPPTNQTKPGRQPGQQDCTPRSAQPSSAAVGRPA